MINLNDRNNVMKLAKGHHKNRIDYDRDEILNHIYRLLNDVNETLELIYDLTFLEGTLVCDSYHMTKHCFDDFGENYGYIHTYTERVNKTNVFRFQYRRPLPNGNILRKSIAMDKATSTYKDTAFKYSGHELEKDLCIMTEKKYFIARNRSKKIRSILRQLNKFIPKQEDKNLS